MMSRHSFVEREAARLPTYGPAEAEAPDATELSANRPDDRASYRAVELIRAAGRSAGAWMFSCRWRERIAQTPVLQDRLKTVPYIHLGEIDLAGDAHLSIITTYAILHLEGRGLLAVAAELGRQRVEALQEFDAARWDEPAAGQPLIARIRAEPFGKAASL